MAVDDVVTEFFIDGAWTKTVSSINLDDRVRKNPGLRITRGTSDQQSTITAASSEFEVNNADGLFSNRNPNSPLFSKLPRYTKVRHYVPNAAGNTDNYTRWFQPNNSGTLRTTDKAQLDFAGDIDIRFDFTPDTWIPIEACYIAGKYRSTGNNRAWAIFIDNFTRINFRWTTDGTIGTQAGPTFSAWPTSRGYGRQIVRITLDVDNGAAGWTAVLYYGDDINGSTWTTVSTVTIPGVTSIYAAGTAPLEIGNGDTVGSPFLNHTQFYGKIHRFQVRNGINGTLVADMNANARPIGDTSWADGLGNTWTLTGKTRIGSDRIRHTGELDTVEYRWDETRRDVSQPLKTQGPLNRLQDTGAPVRSAIYRNMIQYPLTTAYAPLEDGVTATRPSLAAGDAYTSSTAVTFTGSTPSDLLGTAGTARFTGATSQLVLGDRKRSILPNMGCVFLFKLGASLPASNKVLLTIQSTGTIRRWELGIGPASYTFQGFDASNTLVANHFLGFGTGASPANAWVAMQLVILQSGGNFTYTWVWGGIASGLFYVHAVGGTTLAGSIGRMIKMTAEAVNDTAFNSAEFCHMYFGQQDVVLGGSTFRNSAAAWVNELAATRAARIAAENGLTLEVYGNANNTQAMGPQGIGTVFDILTDCAAVDSAKLFDLRDLFGIGYRTRVDMENQFYENFSVTYTNNLLSKVPRAIEDGKDTRNDMTVSRPGGGSGRATLDTGALSTKEPPLGIGFRPGSVSLNAATDDQVQRLAEYEVWKRTRDELRIPDLSFELHRSQIEANITNVSLYERIIAAQLGDWATLTGLPTFLDPTTLRRLSILGYTETLIGQLWTIVFNTATGDAGKVIQFDYFSLADAGNSTLNAGITSSATSLVIKTPTTSCPWVNNTDNPGDFPVSAIIAGEQVSFTVIGTPSVVGSDWQQTATVTRSVNGVVKAQVAGALIETTSPIFLGL